jgi:ABC-2 type transport system permease protein
MLMLVWRSFGRMRRAFASIAAILAGFQVSIVGAAASVEADGNFEQLAAALPAFIQAGFGAALTTFAGTTMLGYFDPVIVIVVVVFAIYVASEPAGDVESGLVDLIVARPLPRRWIIARSLVLMTATVVVLVATMGAATWISLWSMAPAGAVWPELRTALVMMAHLAGVSWCFGCLGLASAAWMQRRASAVGSVALLAICCFLLDVLVEFSTMFRPFWWVTPFHYFHGAAILQGNTDPARNLAVLGGIGVVAAAFAFWQFNRRDL